ncbi:unnamed protein product [marine sediment metagenome]|uniref:Uncharacterized protein n=1 Tax=marine sediment metagenome TaxID=412755 RepID=X1JGZ6_9ZZZZ
MMTTLEIARLLATSEGRRLISTLQRLVQSQGLPLEQVIRESVEHMERLERLAKRTGKQIKQVADDSLDLYEKKEG